MASRETDRRVLMISLRKQSFFDDMYGSLLASLNSKANLRRVDHPDEAIHLLSSQPSAVLVTDEALSLGENQGVWEAVLQYVRNGGTCVVMGHFSGFTKPLDYKPFFAKAGLPWDSGSYHRTTLVLNREALSNDKAVRLAPRYSQKALFVKNVAPQDSWYITDDASHTQSHVFAPKSANISGETAVAFASVGNGKLGYLGDVNAEEESDAVILAMCGI
ncbi:hypothetical protein ACRE_072090 [Hapsidospora chrysogenum ATCC 11550]|uniref:ThuA-like domain-containing protein n=1 Tax=Hapsidospora chrysogenum (strain ATCC 11550 / CBS 779.69 / DSM 880 / IAM 14645 / JCM 23072 / IMI 49137) TaxID=857340 RepID=A0A086SYA7_HAPC1|nr:hypothetical protein ACRE_072090 [Hapsidospora chrysogenum ATCC 11550]